MGSEADKLKGRAKEAAGALGDDDELRREGKADQAGGEIKETIDDAADKARDLVDKGKDALDNDR